MGGEACASSVKLGEFDLVLLDLRIQRLQADAQYLGGFGLVAAESPQHTLYMHPLDLLERKGRPDLLVALSACREY